MKNYQKTGFEEYADEENEKTLPGSNNNLNKKVVLNKIKKKPSLNEIYEMKTNNTSDYSTETFEKLE